MLTSPPESALNRVDLPLPVAPASATTVASPRAARAPALASSARAAADLGHLEPALGDLDRLPQSREPVGQGQPGPRGAASGPVPQDHDAAPRAATSSPTAARSSSAARGGGAAAATRASKRSCS